MHNKTRQRDYMHQIRLNLYVAPCLQPAMHLENMDFTMSGHPTSPSTCQGTEWQQWEDLSAAHARHTCKRSREPCKVVDSWWKFLMLLHSIHPSLCGSSFVRHNWHVMTHHRRRSLQQKLVTRSCGNYQNHVKRCRNHKSFLVSGNSLCFNSN